MNIPTRNRRKATATAARASLLVAFISVTASHAVSQDLLDTLPSERPSQSYFQCEGQSELGLKLGRVGGESVAAVTIDGRRHVLALQEWGGGVAQVKWSDTDHALTWDPGVRITWIDGASTRACGRRVHQRAD